MGKIWGMENTADERQVWKELYKTAVIFRDLRCWEWVSDTDLFGVQDPETGEIGYCCVFGNYGDTFGLGVYVGLKGYKTYYDLLHLEEEIETDQILAGLGQEMLKIEFVDRSEMRKADLQLLKELGIKCRGSHQWIQVRELLPGYLPWFINEKQAVFLTHCLRQAIDVAIRYEDKDDLLVNGEDKILVRIPQGSKQALNWSDQYFDDPELLFSQEEEELKELDPVTHHRVKNKLKKKSTALLFSMSYLPGAVRGEEETRPFFSRLALWIDYGSGMVMGFDIFSPTEFRQHFEDRLTAKLIDFGFIPSQIVVDGWIAFQLLEPLAEAFDIELICAPEEPLFRTVLDSLNTFMDKLL